jgi:hypothetical protein
VKHDPDAVRHWVHIPGFLSQQEADDLYAALVKLPWRNVGNDKSQINFAKAYGGGGKDSTEHPINPFLLPYIARVAPTANAPSNFVKCHRMGPNGIVTPHLDPSGMIVPMLTVGQARTFRVGGEVPKRWLLVKQAKRPMEVQVGVGETEVVMNPGDLLIFNGGRTWHSMDTASNDKSFNPNGHEWRFSLLFRWTTDAMREHGPGNAARKAGHNKQYKAAIESYRNGLTDFQGRELK